MKEENLHKIQKLSREVQELAHDLKEAKSKREASKITTKMKEKSEEMEKLSHES